MAIVATAAGLAGGCPTGGVNPGQFTSCDDLQSVAAVQGALAALAAAGRAFTFFDGSSPFALDGTFQITAADVTFNQDGPAEIDLPGGTMTFSRSTSNVFPLAWQAQQGDVLGASLRGFLNGTSAGVTACILAELQQSTSAGFTPCTTQAALFLSLTPGAEPDELAGTYLLVTLSRLTASADCGEAGDFITGNIALARIDPGLPVLEPLGTVSTGSSAATSLVLASNGAFGFASTAAGSVLRFDVATRQTTMLPLPLPNNATGVGPVSLSPVGTDVGFVTLGDSRLLSYNALGTTFLEAHVRPPQAPSAAVFTPQRPLYDLAASAGFAGVEFQNHRPGIVVFDPLSGPNPVGSEAAVSFTQMGLGLMQISPDASQLAAVLKGGEPGDRARFLAFVSVAAGSLEIEVDIASLAFGAYRGDTLLYSADGRNAFVTDGPRVISVRTAPGYAVSSRDVRADAADQVRQMTVRFDNRVLALTVAGAGDNLVLLDPASLNELHRRREVTLSIRQAGGGAHFFEGSHVFVVDDGAGNIVPVNSESPYVAGALHKAYQSLSGAQTTASATGGRVLAVANGPERAIYLFRLVQP